MVHLGVRAAVGEVIGRLRGKSSPRPRSVLQSHSLARHRNLTGVRFRDARFDETRRLRQGIAKTSHRDAHGFTTCAVESAQEWFGRHSFFRRPRSAVGDCCAPGAAEVERKIAPPPTFTSPRPPFAAYAALCCHTLAGLYL